MFCMLDGFDYYEMKSRIVGKTIAIKELQIKSSQIKSNQTIQLSNQINSGL